MTAYAAQIDPATNVVLRVIVATPEWATEHLGGTWLATADPYSDEPQTVRYCGPGWGADERFPERFAPVWQPPTPDPETGKWPLDEGGELRFHNGRIWRNTISKGTPNVWEPPTNWREFPLVGLPEWVQPTGAGDAYNTSEEVEHLGVGWRSKIDANTTEPGSDVRWWELIDPPDVDPNAPTVKAWKAWSGHNADLYQIGDRVTHNGQTWEATHGNNHWTPGVFGWTVVPA